jgi:UDP-N-acetylmuramoyl-tripeptide--D-alanyl-D-alanine ligase
MSGSMPQSRSFVTEPARSAPAAGAEPAFDGPTIASLTKGVLVQAGSRPVRGAAVDSRRVTPGACFFALPGTRTDGHNFLADAVARGAAALVVTREPSASTLLELRQRSRGAGLVSVIRVADGVVALHAVARAWRDAFDVMVVGVTGSIAKTSTKEAIAETLSERWRVLRSEGNENNEIGLPLTLLRLAPQHQVAVLEMGMYVPGEIRQLATLARPRIGVVTAVRGTHLSRAGSIDAIEQGKGELVESLPLDGTAVLNIDDPRVARMASRTMARSLTYGFDEDADVTAEEVESLGLLGMRFVLRAGSERRRVAIPALGRHSVQNSLAAAAVGVAMEMDLDALVRGLGRGFRAPHRTSLIDAGEWRILDDSYNAAPDSMAAALELLAALPGRRVAVLGEMLELGEGSDEAHRQVGELASAVAELLVVVGDGAKGIAEGARLGGLPAADVIEAPDREAALDALLQLLQRGDVVLVKASRGAELDLLVDRLTLLGAATGA